MKILDPISKIERWNFVFSFNRIDITTPAIIHILVSDDRN